MSEGSTRPVPSCTLQNTLQATWSSESKISSHHQQQQFLCLSYQPRGQIHKLLYSSSTLGFDSSQRVLHTPDLVAHGWRDFVCSPHMTKVPIIPNNHTHVFVARTLLSHSFLCITALLESHQPKGVCPGGFTAASGAGQEGCARVKDRATEGADV